jgi:hypothetical protein
MTTIPDLLKLLFSTFPPLPSDDTDAQLAAYSIAINGHDMRDIEGAVRNFLAGAAPGHNPAFLPSAPLLGSEVRRVMNLRLDSEARDRARRPALPPPLIEHTPESQARVKAKAAELIASLASLSRTDDAAKIKADRWAKTNDRFHPDMDQEAMRQRLGFTVGDQDEDAA